jgi:hypothetical protein
MPSIVQWHDKCLSNPVELPRECATSDS